MNQHQPRGVVARVRSALAPRAKSALLHVGAYGVVRRVVPSRSVAILRYHAICDERGHAYADAGICISPDAFERHARYLAANYRVLPLADVVASLRCGRTVPRNTVALTFDDGYADNLEAARTLNKYGLTATFYLTAGCLDGGDPFWPSEIRLLLPAVQGPTLRIVPDGPAVELSVDTPEARARTIRALTRLFKSRPIPVREAMREQLRRAAKFPSLPRIMLRWDEVAEMHRLGMTIGAHTMTHPNLPSAGLEAATGEIVGAKARLERELSAPVTMFSYPNGGAERYETPELRRIVASAGYAAATTSRNAFAGPRSDLYALERIEVEERLEDLVFALEVERFAFKPQPRALESP